MRRLMTRWMPMVSLGLVLLLQGSLSPTCLAGDLFHHSSSTSHHKWGYTKTKTVTKVYHNAPAAAPVVHAAPVVQQAPVVHTAYAPVTHYVPVYAAPMQFAPAAYAPAAPAYAPAAFAPAAPPFAPAAPMAPAAAPVASGQGR